MCGTHGWSNNTIKKIFCVKKNTIKNLLHRICLLGATQRNKSSWGYPRDYPFLRELEMGSWDRRSECVNLGPPQCFVIVMPQQNGRACLVVLQQVHLELFFTGEAFLVLLEKCLSKWLRRTKNHHGWEGQKKPLTLGLTMKSDFI